MVRPKTDDTQSLVEYSTSGICLPATTACSIFQRRETSSVTLTEPRRCRAAKGREIKRRDITTATQGSSTGILLLSIKRLSQDDETYPQVIKDKK